MRGNGTCSPELSAETTRRSQDDEQQPENEWDPERGPDDQVDGGRRQFTVRYLDLLAPAADLTPHEPDRDRTQCQKYDPERDTETVQGEAQGRERDGRYEPLPQRVSAEHTSRLQGLAVAKRPGMSPAGISQANRTSTRVTWSTVNF